MISPGVVEQFNPPSLLSHFPGMRPLMAGIRAFRTASRTWMADTSPAMTGKGIKRTSNSVLNLKNSKKCSHRMLSLDCG